MCACVEWITNAVPEKKKKENHAHQEESNNQTNKQDKRKENQNSKRHQAEIINETHKYEPPMKFKRKQFYSDQSDFRLLGNYSGMPAYIVCQLIMDRKEKTEISDDDA